MSCSPPGSSVHGIFWAEILEWVAISYCRGSSNPGVKLESLISVELAGGFFTIRLPEKPQIPYICASMLSSSFFLRVVHSLPFIANLLEGTSQNIYIKSLPSVAGSERLLTCQGQTVKFQKTTKLRSLGPDQYGSKILPDNLPTCYMRFWK